jgi:hypothetical protein
MGEDEGEPRQDRPLAPFRDHARHGRAKMEARRHRQAGNYQGRKSSMTADQVKAICDRVAAAENKSALARVFNVMPSFLIELDDTQDEANHIHSVWRDLTGDFGQDLLKQHYETSHRQK